MKTFKYYGVRIPDNWTTSPNSHISGDPICTDNETKIMHLDFTNTRVIKMPKYVNIAHESMHCRRYEKGHYVYSFEDRVDHEVYAILYELHIIWKRKDKKTFKILKEAWNDPNVGYREHHLARDRIVGKSLWKRCKALLQTAQAALPSQT